MADPVPASPPSPTPSPDRDDETHPGFSFSAKKLSELMVPHKDFEKLVALGGLPALLSGLSVHPEFGLATTQGDMSKSLPISSKQLVKTSIGDSTVALAQSGANPDGVSSVDINSAGVPAISIETRRQAFGANTLPAVKPRGLLSYMIAALSDKIMIILSISAVVSLAIGLYQDFKPVAADAPESDKQKIHWIEGFSILVAVLVVVLASSVNDLQKEAQFRKLNAKKEDRYLKAVRDGKTQLVSVYDIVVGDILLLEPGDVIAADGVFVSGMGIRCDESSATGETDAVKKNEDKDPFFLSGSKLLEGVGKYVVTAVGERSFFGKTMMALRTEAEDTPLQVKLDGLAERIAKFGVSVAIVMFGTLLLKYIITVLKGSGFGEATPAQESGSEVAQRLVSILISSITIVVVAVPEGLPLAVTLALAYATTRMLKDNNLVRVLSACETMGNATTICSDKTGTLTQNKMTVVRGAIGKNVFFDGVEDTADLADRISRLPATPSSPVGVPIQTGGKKKSDGPSGTVLFETIMEGCAINSSAFESKDEKTGEVSLVGSKTETALLEWVNRAGYSYSALRSSPDVKVVQVYPFSSERKSMSTVLRVQKSGQQHPVYRLHVKGASEIVLRKCDRFALLPFSDSTRSSQKLLVPTKGSRSNPLNPIICPIDPRDGKPFKDYEALIENYAAQSLRTICLAFREFSEEEFFSLIRGPIKEKVIEARRLEREERQRQLLNSEDPILRADDDIPQHSANEFNGKDDLHPVTPVDDSTTSKNEPLLRVPSTSQSSTHSETRSFETRGVVDDLGPLTDEDILSDPVTRDELIKHLICGAVVGIEDPLRTGVPEAVKQCQQAGVFVRMVTGDNVMTARSIAAQCGIYTRGGIVMEGSYFRKMSPEEMAEKLPRLQVLARSSPTDKQLLVSKLKEMGETVAVTGDGTNDGPALKSADIGFSMGIAGTEVAKEASSIVLMDDSFSSVVKAIVWGRQVNDSVKKFLQFQLSVNVSAVVVTFVSAVSDSSEGSVLTAVQLLWVNLIMDTLAALALATEKPVPDLLLKRPPESKRAPLISFGMWKMILCQAALQVAINLALVFAGADIFQMDDLIAAGGLTGASSTAPDAALEQKAILRTIIFNSFVLLQVFNLINSRRLEGHINIFDKIWENPLFIIITGLICIMQVIIVQFGGQAFQTVGLSGKYWAICIVIGIMSLPWGIVIRLFPIESFFDNHFGHHDKYSAHHDIELMRTMSDPADASDPRSVVPPPSSPVLASPVGSLHALDHLRVQIPTPAAAGGGGFGGNKAGAGIAPPPGLAKVPSHQFLEARSSPVGPGTSSSTVGSRRSSILTGGSSQDRVYNPAARQHWNTAIRTVQTELSVFRALRASARQPQSAPGTPVPSAESSSPSVHPSLIAVAAGAGTGGLAQRKSAIDMARGASRS